jgi:hypothetical protein
MDEWRFIADRKIKEAMEEGAFERLDGEGQPIDLRENPFEDPSLRLAHRLLRNNGFAPAWIEEGKEIEREIRSLTDDLSADERRRRVDDINRRILNYNLKAPQAAHKLVLT